LLLSRGPQGWLVEEFPTVRTAYQLWWVVCVTMSSNQPVRLYLPSPRQWRDAPA
jgi:hypothetical protein